MEKEPQVKHGNKIYEPCIIYSLHKVISLISGHH